MVNDFCKYNASRFVYTDMLWGIGKGACGFISLEDLYLIIISASDQKIFTIGGYCKIARVNTCELVTYFL